MTTPEFGDQQSRPLTMRGAVTGPQLPTMADVWVAQDAAHNALTAPYAEYEAAVKARAQTEAALNYAQDREYLAEQGAQLSIFRMYPEMEFGQAEPEPES